MKELSLGELLKRVWALAEDGQACTLFGIGPMSERVIRCSLELGRDLDFPLMFIASRNQVNEDGGYVKGWDQRAMVDTIKTLADAVGFNGLLYLCRDHGGPWQKDEEKRAKLPPEEAMTLARKSFRCDLEGGFNVLHVDPTKDPHLEGAPSLDLVIERTVQLMKWIEEDRNTLGLGPVGYEVGTEETKGGLIGFEAFEGFLSRLGVRLEEENLPKPDLIVGQTGTLVKMACNAGEFTPETAQALAKIAKGYGIGFKEHNLDYVSADILESHPGLGITSANVAPEFGVEETRGFIQLANEYGHREEAQKYLEKLTKISLESGRWIKWLMPGSEGLTKEDILRDEVLLMQIVEVAGHYVYDDPEVAASRDKMMEAIASEGVQSPEISVDERVKASLKRYVDYFKLAGLTSKVCGDAGNG